MRATAPPSPSCAASATEANFRQAPLFVFLDLAWADGSLGIMAKLAPRPRSVARVLIAGVLAWALAIQGLAAAAAPHTGFADAGAFSAGVDLCATETDGEKHSPGHHDPCACCILCPSCYFGGLAWMPFIPPKGVDLPQADLDGSFRHFVLFTETVRPPGWTSSWSQRAPPAMT